MWYFPWWQYCTFAQPPIPCLQGLHAHKDTELLEDDELEGGGGGESRPDGDEATPQGERALVADNLDQAVGGVVVDLGIGWLVHQSGTDHVEGTDGAGHEETGGGGGKEGGEDAGTLEAGHLNDDALGLIVDAHLGTVQDHGAHDVGIDATVESADALLGHELLGGADDGGGAGGLGGHHLGLENVERVTGEGTQTTGGGTGGKLLEEGGRLGVGAAEGNLAGLVQTETEGGVGGLPKPGGVDTLPEGREALARDDLLGSTGHTEGTVLGRYLNAGLSSWGLGRREGMKKTCM